MARFTKTLEAHILKSTSIYRGIRPFIEAYALPRHWRHTFSKVLSLVTFYSTCSKALTFENVGAARDKSRRVHHSHHKISEKVQENGAAHRGVYALVQNK